MRGQLGRAIHVRCLRRGRSGSAIIARGPTLWGASEYSALPL
eukprot:jgi/Mesen1/4767/ME000242S03940